MRGTALLKEKQAAAEQNIVPVLELLCFRNIQVLVLEVVLQKIKEQGFEQAELMVVGGNDRAYHLYESLGFKECGRIPKANKYDDGTYSDDVLMVLPIRGE